MFEWLAPSSCPCDAAAKAWVEERLLWLRGQFPKSIFTGQPLVLPTEEFFPEHYDGSDASVLGLLERVCGHMGVASEKTEVSYYSNAKQLWLVNDAGHWRPRAAGTYQQIDGKFHIRIEESQIGEPAQLVGTFAHELAHARLLGEGRVDRNEYDNELLTDLTAVFLGFGIFLANSPRAWRSQLTTWPGTDLKKPEYMTTAMYGYVLAHLAWFHNEPRPRWMRHLHANSRPDVKQSIRFLNRTRESTFTPRIG